MAAQMKHLQSDANRELAEHPFFKALLTKLGKDNVGMLAAFVSWNLLTSLVPVMVGLIAISGFLLQSPSSQASVITHVHAALQGALSRSEIASIVHSSTKHAGLLGIVGFLGVLWGGSNVGGSFSTAFQAIFEVEGRNFFKEKAIDIGMIFVFTALMLIILAATTAASLLGRLFASFPLSGGIQLVIGTVISLLAAILLFATIYLVFPNIQPKFRFANVWRGAILAGILFQILTYIWPIYAHYSHFQRYGAVFVPILVLSAWIYFFSLLTMVGAEVVAVGAIREAKAEGQSVGPGTNDTVPQHRVLRNGKNEGGKTGTSDGTNGSGSPSQSKMQLTKGYDGRRGTLVESDDALTRDPRFWLLAATPIVVTIAAAAREILVQR